MKTMFKKTLVLALCFLNTSDVIYSNDKKKKPNATEIAAYLKNVFEQQEGYIEDHLEYIKNTGHENLAAFLEELRNGYKEYEPNSLFMKAYALSLVVKHRISLPVANKVRILMEEYKGKDHVWIAALERSRDNTVVTTIHEEDNFEYKDAEGNHHDVHMTTDITIEDTTTTDDQKKVAKPEIVAAQGNVKNRG